MVMERKMPDTLTLDVLVDGTRAAEKLGTDGFEITLQGGGYNAPENAGTGFVHAVLQVCLVPTFPAWTCKHSFLPARPV